MNADERAKRNAEITAALRAGEHPADLADRYGLNRGTVTRIGNAAGVQRTGPRKQMAQDHPCIDCGAPAIRAGARCLSCTRRHKRAYNAERGHPARVSPEPRPQEDPDLPPFGEMVVDEDRVQCHVCGQFFRALPSHIRRHGMTPVMYRETYELAAKTSLLSPATRDRLANLARDRDLASLGTPIPPGGIPGRQRGQTSNLGARINVRDGIAARKRE